ncbi:YjgN family protein [Sulfurimonas sp.]|uniref:YjgN family protein n=1 Tax=Sulfurimonas sp. TaxID=2022749 RepID=UPI003D0F52BA
MKSLEFKGSGTEYFKIWIVNALLIILTLGLYYPWAKVRRNRYFYGNSVLGERNFEYHAVGKQIFLSYLVALILFIAYVAISQVFPPAGSVFMLILFIFIPWIVVKSMMFNFKMTSFSNVRFSFNKNFSEAYINLLLLPMAFYGIFIISAMIAGGLFALHYILGIIGVIGVFAFVIFTFAFFKKRNSEFFINNTNYGQGKFIANLNIKELSKISAKVMGIGLALMLVLFIIAGIIVSATVGLEALQAASESLKNPEQGREGASVVFAMIGALYIGMIFIILLVNAYSFALYRKYIYDNTLFDEKIKFASTLKGSTYMWVVFSNFFLVLFTLGFGAPWAKVRAAKVVLTNTHIDTSHGFDEYISQAQAQTSAIGDQIGDAFDVDVGIGF